MLDHFKRSRRELILDCGRLAGCAFVASPHALTTNDDEHRSHSSHVLWYRQPAKQWVEALPIGNGRLGAMVFGGVEKERIQLNESSLWSGAPQDADNPDALQYLPEIRRASGL